MGYKVGKKYRSSWDDNAIVWTCVWHSISGNALFENGLDLMIAYPEDDFWEEVKEKIIVTKYVHWYKWKDGKDVWTVTNNSPMGELSHNKKHIKTDTITCEVEVE